ncbi:MAG: phosphatidate cytidylyltransferase [Proteobacteria bacterium]|nr:phosphatidate cytidylyltransferase [Pseudomonadota bacterium]
MSSGRTQRWGDLRLRFLSALVLGPLALACLWLGGAAFVALIAVGAFGCLGEWLRMCGRSRAEPAAVAGFAGLAAALAATVLDPPLYGIAALVAAGAAAFALAPARPHRALTGLGVPYVGFAAVALVWLRADPVAGRAGLIFLVLTIWGSDIGAYVAGRLIGGPKLAPAISPGKTWSGAAGGLVGACAAGLAAAALFAFPLAPGRAIAAAALLGVVGEAGDLLESLAKRHFGVKDSGRTIPGHGGLLDRLDALILAAPVAGLLALALGRGVVLWQ